MRTRFASLTAGIGALALAVTGIVALGTQAEAYSGTPPWVGNTDDAAHVKGSLVLYNASGAQITSGSSIQALAAYVGTTGDAPRSGATKATANLFSPDPANTAVTTWGSIAVQSNYTWSPTPAGTPSFAPAAGAFLKLNASGQAIEDLASGLVLYSGADAAYLHTLELRVQDSGVGVVADGGKYWRTVLEYNPTSAVAAYDGLAPGAWRQIYPVVTGPSTVATTTTTPTAAPSGSQVLGTSITFSTTVAPASGTLTGGTVAFFDGATQIGAAKTVAGTATSGSPASVSSDATSGLAVGTHSITARFTPSAGDAAGFSGSTSSAFSQVITAMPVTSTTTTTPTAAPSGSQVLGTSITFSTTVAPASGTLTGGTVAFFDGATQIGAAKTVAGTATSGSPASVSSDATSGLAVGTHSITARFTPSAGDAAGFSGSTSPALSQVITSVPVVADATTTTIASTSPSGTATTGDLVTVTVQVADSTSPSTVVTSGTVAVKVGATTVAQGAVDGSGTFVTTVAAGQYFSLGTNSLTAAYTGNASFADSSTAVPTTYTVTLGAPVNAVLPAAGAARVGVASTCNPGSWSAAFAYSYEWFERATVSGAWTRIATTRTTALLAAGSAGHQLKCVVTAYNPTTAVAESAPVTVALGAASKATTKPRILGTPVHGKRLTAYRGVWSPAATRYLYVWKIGTLVVARTATYVPPLRFKGRYLVLVVSAVRPGHLTGTAVSARVLVR